MVFKLFCTSFALSSLALAGSHVEKLPEFKLRDTKGKQWSKATLLPDKTYVFKFWATWCTTCKKLEPIVDALYADHKANGLEVVEVSIDTDMGALQKRMKDHPKPYPIVLDPKSDFLKKLGSNAVPTTIMVRNGNIVGRWIGATDLKTLTTAFENSKK